MFKSGCSFMARADLYMNASASRAGNLQLCAHFLTVQHLSYNQTQSAAVVMHGNKQASTEAGICAEQGYCQGKARVLCTQELGSFKPALLSVTKPRSR